MKIATLLLICLSFGPSRDLIRLVNFAEANLPKKVEKDIKRLWKKAVISFSELKSHKMHDLVLYEINANGEQVGFVCLKEAKGCRIGGCEAEIDNLSEEYWLADGAYERFAYYLILDDHGVVLRTGIFDYPGDYGYEITSKWWQKQFQGYVGGRLTYGKNVDAISGATISAQSMCFDLEYSYDIVKTMILE